VWWYEDPRAGRRPFLVLTRDAAIPVLNQVLAVPATRTIRDIPTEVRLGTDDRMPDECVLSLDNVTVIRPALCTERITTLEAERMHEICRALSTATDCEWRKHAVAATS
jgi:mRNA interferase MazF